MAREAAAVAATAAAAAVAGARAAAVVAAAAARTHGSERACGGSHVFFVDNSAMIRRKALALAPSRQRGEHTLAIRR